MWPCDDGAQEGSNVETRQMCLEPGKFFFSYFKKTSLTFFLLADFVHQPHHFSTQRPQEALVERW